MNNPTAIIVILFMSISTGAFAQNRVKMHEGVMIGGIKQWIGADSEDDSKPLLLFLHGGPGFSSRAYSKQFVRNLKKDFIVAQWDQRGTGITETWGSENDSLSLELMHSDTEEVVNFLLKRFAKERLYLVGFSWGGFLGLHLAAQHPELLHAYISVSAMIHGDASERETLNVIREQARQADNEQAQEELATIHIPFRSWEELYYQRKWTAHFSGKKASKRQYPESLFRDWSQKWMTVFQEASAVNYAETFPEIDCPIYFFMSKKDLVANFKVSVQYFNGLKAEVKHIVWFEESTHEIPNQEPKKFSQELIKISQTPH